MKFGARLNYLATWLGMLAAGSWMLPVFTLGVAPRVVAAAPATSGSNDDGWTGSEVATAWALATGSEYSPASQVLAIESGVDSVPVLVDRVSVEDGASLGLSWFMVDRSLPIAETTDETDATDEVSVVARAELVSGRVVGAAGHPGYFSGIRFAMSAEVPIGAGASQFSEEFALLPFAAFQTEADAIAFHDSMVEASQGEGEGGSGGGGIFCVNPNWRGFNGVECCMFESAYQTGLKACRAMYWARFVACIVAALGAVVGTWKLCLEGCRYPCMAGPAFCAPCTKACFWLGGLAGLGVVIACEFQNQKWYQSCILEKLATYQTDLAENGCPPKPGTQGAVMPSVEAESGIFKEAETLTEEAD
jgi:hypothetical protein